MDSCDITQTTRHWVESLVVELNLCPFAKRELVKDRVRFAVVETTETDVLLQQLQFELEKLSADETIETTLLIHPQVLQDFYDYNDFLNLADDLLRQLRLEGLFQIASFHPNYQFGGTQPDDAENYTNRSPYPMLHLIREASLEQAVANYPDSDKIPERNIALMESMGVQRLQAMLAACFTHHDKSETQQ